MKKLLTILFAVLVSVSFGASVASADLLPTPLPNPPSGCIDSGIWYPDGSIKSCINTNGIYTCPTDTAYICTNGRWVMQGRNPWRPDYRNRAPVISSFYGPTTLKVNKTGTWRVVASDPENGNLTYNIDWGDDPVYYASNSAVASDQSFRQQTSFQHVYSQAGTYTVRITVTDDAGKSTISTATVRVTDNTYQPYNPNPWQWWNNTDDYYYYNYDWTQPQYYWDDWGYDYTNDSDWWYYNNGSNWNVRF